MLNSVLLIPDKSITCHTRTVYGSFIL